MPKDRVYVQIKIAHSRIRIRRRLDDKIMHEYVATPKNLSKANLVAFRMNNFVEGDNITRRIIEHLNKINQEYKLPSDFAPVNTKIIPEVVIQ